MRIASALLSATLAGCFLPTSCFVPGTRIATPRGERAIETLEIGDEVLAWSFDEERLVPRKVTAIHRSTSREVRFFTIDGIERSGVTLEHPYWIVGRGWVPVREVTVADRVLLVEGRRGAIESIRAEECASPTIDVFNITVETPESNYFADGVLVHNKSRAIRACATAAITQEVLHQASHRVLVQLAEPGMVTASVDNGTLGPDTNGSGAKTKWVFVTEEEAGIQTRIDLQIDSTNAGEPCFDTRSVILYSMSDAGVDAPSDASADADAEASTDSGSDGPASD